MQKNLFTLQQIGEDLGYPEIYSKSIWKTIVSNIFQDFSINVFSQNLIFLFSGFNRTSVNAVRKLD